MLSGIGSIAGPAAILIAALLGKSALSDYREQRITDNQIAVADKALTAAYRASDAVRGMRGRWMPAAELQATEEQLKELGMKLDGMPDELKSATITKGVIYRRAEYFKEDFDAVFAAIPSIRAYFGGDLADAMEVFPRCRNRILNSADMLHMVERRGRDENDKFSVNIRRDVFGSWGEEDEDTVSSELREAVTTLELKLLPIIGRKPDA